MPSRDEQVFGFNAADADELIQLIGSKDETHVEGRVRGSGGATLFLFTLTGTMTAGTGAATIRDMEDDAEIETSSVRDPLGHFNGLTSGYRGICAKQGGNYYALGPYVTAVRWDDPDLEFSRDNATTWINVDTAEDCP